MAAQTNKSKTNRGKSLPNVGEFVRFADAVTENPVVRVTNPNSSSVLPAAANRCVSVKERFLIFTSDRSGRFAPFQVDLRSGMLRQLAEPAKLSPKSLCLDARERSLYFIDDGSLQELNLANRKQQTIAEGVSAFGLGGVAGSFYLVRSGKLEQLTAGKTITLADQAAPECVPRPVVAGGGCLFVRESSSEREFWYAGREAAPKKLAAGAVSDPSWSPDGQSVLFLREVAGNGTLVSEIREVSLDGTPERCISRTSYFASFSQNANGSVFVGASRSKAQPNIVILLRSPQREMTLCEHRSSRPAEVSPIFSPDSKRVYFQSDHEGKPAIYSVNVELLIEPVLDSSA